jgi:hypothetical protein
VLGWFLWNAVVKIQRAIVISNLVDSAREVSKLRTTRALKCYLCVWSVDVVCCSCSSDRTIRQSCRHSWKESSKCTSPFQASATFVISCSRVSCASLAKVHLCLHSAAFVFPLDRETLCFEFEVKSGTREVDPSAQGRVM